VFVILKSLAALSAALPQWEPTALPERVSQVMNRIPNVRHGQSFEDAWAQERAGESARQAINEQLSAR
jgi:hypothetical protein